MERKFGKHFPDPYDIVRYTNKNITEEEIQKWNQDQKDTQTE